MFAVGLCVTPTTVLTVEEQSRIKDQLSQNLPGKDLETTYYNVASLKLLNAAIPKAEVKYILRTAHLVYKSADLYLEAYEFVNRGSIIFALLVGDL